MPRPVGPRHPAWQPERRYVRIAPLLGLVVGDRAEYWLQVRSAVDTRPPAGTDATLAADVSPILEPGRAGLSRTTLTAHLIDTLCSTGRAEARRGGKSMPGCHTQSPGGYRADMEPLSGVVAVAIAKAVAGQVATYGGKSLVSGAKKYVITPPEEKALSAAIQRAYAAMIGSHSAALAQYGVSPTFLEHEGAAELAKAMMPGSQPSAARLAELSVDFVTAGLDHDARLDCILAVRPAFTDFIESLRHELRQERALDAAMQRIDNAALADTANRVATKLGAASASPSDESEYLVWLVDQHRYLRTAGMVRNTTVQVPLDEVFVDLSAERDRTPGHRTGAWLRQERKRLEALLQSGDLDLTTYESTLDRLMLQIGHTEEAAEPSTNLKLLDAAGASARLLVLGDPGSGKTTALRYLALQHARACLRSHQEPQHGQLDKQAEFGNSPRFPIFVRLGDFARSPDRGAGLGAFLTTYVVAQECRTPGLNDLMARKLADGRCLILLDGLDEVVTAQDRASVVTAVSNFVSANARAGNRFVVTSRIAGYLAAPLPTDFTAVRVSEMDDPTIAKFLSGYCPAIERAETPDKSPEATQHQAQVAIDSLLEALRANAGVARLAANPLLLTALVLVHRARGRLPHRRVDAYVEVSEALGRTWRSVQGVPEADLPDDRLLTAWLTRLGSWLHANRPEGSASKREILGVLGPLWAKMNGSEWQPALLEQADPLESHAGLGIQEFLLNADVHTGLLVERAPGRYGFPHLTFEEYYAGRSLAFEGLASDRASRIRQRLHDPRYDEPILLALGLIGREQPEELESLVADAIRANTPLSDRVEGLLLRDFLFGLRLLADDVPLDTLTIDALLQRATTQWFDEGGPCRFTRYRLELRDRLTSLRGTRSMSRLGIAVERIAPRMAAESPVRLCELLATLTTDVPPSGSQFLTAFLLDPQDAVLQLDAASALQDRGSPPPAVTSTLLEIAAGAADDVARDSVARRAENRLLTGRTFGLFPGAGADDAYAGELRYRAATLLARTAPLTREALLAIVRLAITSDEWNVIQRVAANLLGGQPPSVREVVMEELVGVACDPTAQSSGRRAIAVLQQAPLDAEGVSEALAKIASQAPDTVRRRDAARALRYVSARLGWREALHGIAEASNDESVRLIAFQALASQTAVVADETRRLASVALQDRETPALWLPAARLLVGRSSGGSVQAPEEAVDVLSSVAVSAGDPDDRLAAFGALANVQRFTSDLGEQLLAMLADPDLSLAYATEVGDEVDASGPEESEPERLATLEVEELNNRYKATYCRVLGANLLIENDMLPAAALDQLLNYLLETPAVILDLVSSPASVLQPSLKDAVLVRCAEIVAG